MTVPWKPVVIALAAVVAVGGAILLATHMGSSRSPAATKGPTPSAASPIAGPSASPEAPSASPAATPRGQTTSPAATPAHPASSGPKASPGSSPVPAVPPGFVAGSYGFAYPEGWAPGPLVVSNSLVSTETVTAPSGGGRIDYLKESSTAIYNPDHTVNDNHIEVAIEKALPGCGIIVGVTPEPNVGFRYVCAAGSGIQITGLAIVAPYAKGVRVVQVTIPLAQGDTAVAILNSFH